MSTESENNKRIAVNTLYMYLRMFVTMAVGLYTSRVVLNTLGVSDYGVQNVMGGIIGMLAYVNTLISGGTSRFLTIDLGKGDMDALRRTFSMANTLAVAAAVIILLLGETVGYWFMANKLNIDPLRMDAAKWVYQGALLSCCLTVLQTPYSASIISHEKMNIYAYMSIFEAVMKLLIVYLLVVIDYDKLIIYACLLFCVDLASFIIYRVICTTKFTECSFTFDFDKDKFKDMMTYSGWNMVGAFANVLNGSGLSILLNIFFGTTVNAARGIAMQVSNIVTKFCSNFQVASQPQIYKYYAQGDIEGMNRLICNNSKYCSYLLLCLIIPIFCNVEGLIQLWLGQVPEHTVWFTRLILLQILFQSIDIPVGMGIHAVGKMKLPNLTAALLYLGVFPLTYIAFKLGFSPIFGYCIFLASTPFILMVDAWILHKYVGFDRGEFFRQVLSPLLVVTVLGSILPVMLMILNPDKGFVTTFFNTGLSVLYVAAVVFFIGLTKDTRALILRQVSDRFRRGLI